MAVMVVVAGLMMGLAALGMWKNYSAVPLWDMWDGTVGFVVRVLEGDHGAWWAQHNEHRIVLARMLFWLDHTWFGDAGVLLLVVNYLCVLGAAWVLYAFLRRLDVSGRHGRWQRLTFGLFLSGWLFAWIQEGNLVVGFQAQFFLAFLLPLAAFFWLARALESGRPREFMLACLFGVASVGAMANGVLVLPLMLVLSLLSRCRWSWRIALLVAALALPAVYFHDYVRPSYHGSALDELKHNPAGVVQFALVYLGAPFHHLIGDTYFQEGLPSFFGFVLVVGTAAAFVQALWTRQASPYLLGLFLFIAYVVGSALATGGGRLQAGLDQALTSRYSTPALMAWAAFWVVAYHSSDRVRYFGLRLAAAMSLLMVLHQFDVLNRPAQSAADREMAALALELGVRDEEAILNVYPFVDSALTIAGKARVLRVSVFDRYPFRGLRDEWGRAVALTEVREPCVGSLDLVRPIAGASGYLKIEGWMFQSSQRRAPGVVRFVRADGTLAGVALTGAPRPDVAQNVHPKAAGSGFRGYLAASTTGHDVVAVGDAPVCKLSLRVPQAGS